jgi:predicted dithiol-disulfide oxidoreductase (DUF899 family)
MDPRSLQERREMHVTNLRNESEEYLARRDELRSAEIDAMRQREHVAALRRNLPQGAAIDDYVFSEGPADLDEDEPIREVRLSQLFSAPGRTLIIYHLMYGKKNTTPCPMCSMWIDGYNGVAHHLTQNVDFAIAAAAEPLPLRTYARERSWRNLRLLSCGDSTFKYDLASEDSEGNQDSTLSVFRRDADGTLRHFYTTHPWMSDDINERGIDLLTPVYNMLDLTPEGRGDWYAELSYPRDLQPR